jgi:predicted aspartyl protease
MDIGKYELANGSTIECKRYLLNKLNFGKFIVSNVIIAATEKPVTILIGRTLLNKFRKWNVDNEKNLLILEK